MAFSFPSWLATGLGLMDLDSLLRLYLGRSLLGVCLFITSRMFSCGQMYVLGWRSEIR